MNCELSIIVPVYNTAQYLPQCIESYSKAIIQELGTDSYR